nr:polysaccharide biosynthesis tyrosine autokinase [uncultured Sphingomonas sp.]
MLPSTDAENLPTAKRGTVPGPLLPPDSGNSKQDSGLDFYQLFGIILGWWRLILAFVVAGIALAVISTLMTKPLFRAKVVLEVNPPSVEILDEKQRGVQSGVDSYTFVQTQVGLLKSQSVAERTAEDLNLAADRDFVGEGGSPEQRLARAAGRVAGGIRVMPPEDSQLIEFTYTDDSANRAASIANGVADSFIGSGLQRRYEASNYAREFLQKEIAKTRVELEASEKALADYARAQGIIEESPGASASATGQTSLQGQSMFALNSALAEATARRVAAEGAYRAASIAVLGTETNASTGGLRAAKAQLEAQYAEKRTLLKPDHPDMVSLRSQIDQLDREIARERSQAAGAATATLQANFRAALAAENALKARVAQLKDSVLDLRGRSIRYGTLQRDVSTNRELYEALLNRYKNVGVGSGIGNSPISIVDRAQPPGGPFTPNLIKNLMIGLLAGLFAGIATAVALEFLNDTIKTRDDVRNKLRAACLGVIPKMEQGSNVMEELMDLQSQVSEAYAAVMASLRFSSDGGAPRLLLLASARASEGKSSTAMALAINYARRGERVLLIDADLRRPAFASVKKSVGLTELLTSDDALQKHVSPTQFENFWLLPSGSTAPNPAELLSSARLSFVLNEALDHFDRVIVDGPPILGLADGQTLAAAVHNVLLVVESGKTRTGAAKEAIDRIKFAGAHLVGAVLTKSALESSTYAYGYGYGYGKIGERADKIRLAGPAEE